MTRDRRLEASRIAQAAARGRPKTYDPPAPGSYDELLEPAEKPPPTADERATPRHSPKMVHPLDYAFRVKVVGVTFAPGYPENLAALERAQFARYVEHGDEKLPAVLVRRPDNPHDTNAIEIHVTALGDDGMVGHVPAHLARRLAPSLDQGDIWQAFVHQVAVDDDHPGRPGCWVEAQPVPNTEDH